MKNTLLLSGAMTLIATWAAAQSMGYYRLPGDGTQVRPNPTAFVTKYDVLLGGHQDSDPTYFAARDMDYSIVSNDAQFRICADAKCVDQIGGWTTNSTVRGGQYIQMRIPGPTAPGGVASGSIEVNGTQSTFLAGGSKTPPSFDGFNSQIVDPNRIVESNLSTFRGWIEVDLRIEGGKVRVCSPRGQCGSFSSSAVKVHDGDQVQIQAESGDFSENRAATVRAGGAVGTWNLSTRAIDQSPDAFVLSQTVVGADPGMIVSTSGTTLKGFDRAPIRIENGSYSIDGGAFTSKDGTVSSGSVVVVRMTTGTFDERVASTLHVGDKSATFEAVTRSRRDAPSAFSFEAASGAEPGSTVVSDVVTLANHDGVDVSVSGGQYQVCASSCTDEGWRSDKSRLVPAGTRVRVRTTAGDFSQKSVVTLNAGTAASSFTVTSRDRDTVPDAFQIPAPHSFHEPGEIVMASIVGLEGFDDAPITISGPGASYSIDGGAYTTSPGRVTPQSNVAIQIVAGDFSQTRTATIAIGGVSTDMVVKTRQKDTSPDAFAFETMTGVQPGASVTSKTIELSGFDDAPYTVGGGEARIDDKAFSTSAGTVASGSSVTLRATAGGLDETRTVTLRVGDVQSNWTIVTRERDVTPDAFAFTAPASPSEPAAIVTSGQVTLAGFDDAPISVSGQSAEYSVNAGSWSTAPSRVRVGDKVAVRLVSADWSGTRQATLTVGGASATFEVATRNKDERPDTFTFTAVEGAEPGSTVSASATIKGFDDALATLAGDPAEFSVGSGTFSSSSRSVRSGEVVTLRSTAPDFSQTRKIDLTIGGTTGSWNVTTRAIDTAPDAFSFQAGPTTAVPGSVQTSSSVVPVGYDRASISVTGGEYRIGTGQWTSTSGNIAKGEAVTVRGTAAGYGGSQVVNLTVGGVKSSWTIGSRPEFCSTPWGAQVKDGSSVTAYPSASVPYGSSCSSQAQTRTCDAGVLSGSASSASCSVQAPVSCSTSQWGTVAHGQSVTAYASSSVSYGNSCASQTRTCNNGTMSGSYTATSCSVQAPANCTTPWGQFVAHGSSVTAYASYSVSYGSSCSSQTRYCNNGSLSGSYGAQSCSAPSCAPNYGQPCGGTVGPWVSNEPRSCGGQNCKYYPPGYYGGVEHSCYANGDGSYRVTCTIQYSTTYNCQGQCVAP